MKDLSMYSVLGRLFQSATRAELFARHLALRDGEPVPIMEKVDGLPWHICATITAE